MAYFPMYKSGNYNAVTVSRSGTICNYIANVGGVPLSRFIANITPIQEGSGDPSPSNPRAINGVSEVKTVNTPDSDWCVLWQIDNGFKGIVNFNQLVGYYATNRATINSLGNNEYKATSDGSTTYFGFTLRQSSSVAINTVANHIYYFATNITDISVANLNAISIGNTINLDLGNTTGVKNGIAKASGSGALYFITRCLGTSQTSDYFTAKDTVLIDLTQMFGSTIADYIYSLEQNEAGAGVAFFRNLYPDDYYAYTAGTTETVGGDDKIETTTALGGTYYGGTLNVGTGVLTVTHGMVDLSSLSWTYETDAKRWRGIKSDMKQYSSRSDDITFEKYATDTTATIGSEWKGYISGSYIYIHSLDSTTPPSGNAVYPLATPATVQLTPAQLTQLLGENNVWADSGDSEVDFFKIIRT